jgi:DNA-binding transcriptional MerR regulator
MFRIGEFSRLSRVSVKMLRHYDAIGLLPAAWVDPQTDYRYYSADQLPRLNRVLALKELGFSLEQIVYLLGAELSTGQMCRMLALRRSEIEQEMEAHQARLRLVDARLRQLEATGASPAYDVVLRRVERQQVASIRTVLPSLNAIERLFHEVETFATRRRCRAPRPPLLLYHDADSPEDEVDIEVAVPVTDRPAPAGRVRIADLPGAETMACVAHTGSYATIMHATAALVTWINTHGYRSCGPLREVYIRFDAAGTEVRLPAAFLTRSSGEYVTELHIPVEQR